MKRKWEKSYIKVFKKESITQGTTEQLEAQAQLDDGYLIYGRIASLFNKFKIIYCSVLNRTSAASFGQS